MATLGCFFDFDGSYDLQNLESSQNRHHHRMPHRILRWNTFSRLWLQPIMASLIQVYNCIINDNLRLPLCLSPSVLFRRWILVGSCFFFLVLADRPTPGKIRPVSPVSLYDRRSEFGRIQRRNSTFANDTKTTLGCRPLNLRLPTASHHRTI